MRCKNVPKLFICSSSQVRLYHPTDPRRRREVLGFGQAGTEVAVLAVDGSAKGSEGTAMAARTTAAPTKLVVELPRGLLQCEGVSLHEDRRRGIAGRRGRIRSLLPGCFCRRSRGGGSGRGLRYFEKPGEHTFLPDAGRTQRQAPPDLPFAVVAAAAAAA
ncbi:hypothetical protein BHM03_00045209 [Ensete ventricosum]|nr:hypothetical protein BHM03_00045209 [Ensete ventricosum]